MPHEILYKSNPLMLRNNPFGFIACILLIPFFGLGLLILLIWWLIAKCTSLHITNEKIVLRKGILSKQLNEVHHQDVRNIQINQGPIQRLLKTGKIGVSTAGQSEIEISISGIPNPEKVKSLIDQMKKKQI